MVQPMRHCAVVAQSHDYLWRLNPRVYGTRFAAT